MTDRRIRVWGGLTFVGGKQHREIVGAPNKKRALELLRLAGEVFGMAYFTGYWTETHNEREVSIATKEGVWRAHTTNYNSPFGQVL